MPYNLRGSQKTGCENAVEYSFDKNTAPLDQLVELPAFKLRERQIS